MENEKNIPTLLKFLFGEAADVALDAASPRLLRWCQAYEDWLAQQRLRNASAASAAEQAHWAWRMFLGQVHHMPWQITQVDVKDYTAWMRSRDYAPGTIGVQLRLLTKFYRWCSDRRIDPECTPGFNPAAKVRRPSDPHYRGRKLLSLEEVRRLLAFMQRDTSPLGRRDFAFVLARLRLGAPQRRLQQLKWGQIEQDGAYLRWRPEAQPCPLPVDVWEAIRAALQAGGRLPGMQPEDYIFTPLADPYVPERGTHAQDWRAGKYMDRHSLRDNLNLYGRAAGIPHEKLNPQTLRLTAIRIHLDECAGLDDRSMLAEMRLFMDSREDVYHAKHRLSKLPHLPSAQGPWQPDSEAEIALPVRERHLFKSEDRLTHGFYAVSQPPQEIAEILAENVQGIDVEFKGLRILGRGLLTRQERSNDSREFALLAQAYTLYTSRLAQLVRAEAALEGRDELDQTTRDFLERMDKKAIEEGEPTLTEMLQRELETMDPELEAINRHLAEEVAGLRYTIRKTFRLAMEANEAYEYATLVDVYGRACVRMVKHLKSQGSSAERIQALLTETIKAGIYQFQLELGLIPGEA